MGWIDAHTHVWSPDWDRYPAVAGTDLAAIAPASFRPEDFWAHAEPCGVDRVVLIQMSYYGTDNTYLLETIAAAPERYRGVAVVEVDAPDLADTLAALRPQGVTGVRVYPPGEEQATWIETPGYDTLFSVGAELGIAVCPLIDARALPSLARQAARHPRTTVVIDHLCRIGVGGVVREADVAALCGLARLANVHVKVSAFYALGSKQAPYDDLQPLIRQVLSAYGTARAMWASDCPYQVVHGSYEAGLELVRDRLGLSHVAMLDVLERTAARVFFA